MSRLAACPKCRNQFTLPELTGPATIACPFCAAHITIKMKSMAPPPARVVPPPMAVAQALPVEDDDEQDYRPKKKKKKKASIEASGSDEKWMKVAMLVGIFLITVIAIVATFAWFLYAGKSGPTIIMPTNTVVANGQVGLN